MGKKEKEKKTRKTTSTATQTIEGSQVDLGTQTDAIQSVAKMVQTNCLPRPRRCRTNGRSTQTIADSPCPDSVHAAPTGESPSQFQTDLVAHQAATRMKFEAITKRCTDLEDKCNEVLEYIKKMNVRG